LEAVRRILRPVQKLFWNPTPMISALSRQSDLNTYYVHLLHNMVGELTRLNLEVQELKNRALQLQARLDLQARRRRRWRRCWTSATAARRSAAGGRSELTPRRVHQLVAALSYGDAIGNEALAIQGHLRRAGFESDIFAERVHPAWPTSRGRCGSTATFRHPRRSACSTSPSGARPGGSSTTRATGS